MKHKAGLYRWEFEKGTKSLSVAVNGLLIVDDLDLVIRAATDGVGLAYMSEENAASHLARGALVRVLKDWYQPFPGFLLYHPSRPQTASRPFGFAQRPSHVVRVCDESRLSEPDASPGLGHSSVCRSAPLATTSDAPPLRRIVNAAS